MKRIEYFGSDKKIRLIENEKYVRLQTLRLNATYETSKVFNSWKDAINYIKRISSKQFSWAAWE